VEHEATSRGAAFLLAGRPKFWPETETGSWFNPRPEPELKKRFKRWLTLMEKAIEPPNKGDI
jgi:glycerol kinase